MYEVQKDKKSIELIATSYQNTNQHIHESIKTTLGENLKKWKADITEDNRIIFFSPEVIFGYNEVEVTQEFQKILDLFFPQLIQALENVENEIEEIRIEGHTDNVWNKSSKNSYTGNMYVSQQRALNVLEYAISINDPNVRKNLHWLHKKLIAVGMSYSQPITIDDKVDWEKSKRVEFKIVTKSKDKLYNILNKAK
jgi:outer membrane protein OmpA-like peptidoglycan-associated protein